MYKDGKFEKHGNLYPDILLQITNNSKRYNFQELRNGNFIDINAYFNEEICGREKNKRIYW